MTACADSSIPFYALITFFLFFPSFFPFISNNCNYQNLISLLLFPIKINVNVVKTVCFDNNLPTHIRENTDFPQQKPQQLPSAKANFEGCRHPCNI